MTMKDEISLELNRITVLSGNGSLSADTANGRLECDIASVDNLACAFDRFELKSDRLAGASTEQLKKVCDSLSSRLSYLLEPIALIETDSDGCVLQMRSNPPSHEEDKTSYYELVASRGGSLKLCRFGKQSGSSREVVPASVTLEVFHRLVNDFDAAVA